MRLYKCLLKTGFYLKSLYIFNFKLSQNVSLHHFMFSRFIYVAEVDLFILYHTFPEKKLSEGKRTVLIEKVIAQLKECLL